LNLISDEKCYEYLRQIRWKGDLICPHYESKGIIKNGIYFSKTNIYKYNCFCCYKDFNDLTQTVFAESKKPLKVWVMALYFMGLNLSNIQIGKGLDMSTKTAQKMTTLLKTSIVKKKPDVLLSKEVEIDEAYVVSGHKGQTEKVKRAQRKYGLFCVLGYAPTEVFLRRNRQFILVFLSSFLTLNAGKEPYYKTSLRQF